MGNLVYLCNKMGNIAIARTAAVRRWTHGPAGAASGGGKGPPGDAGREKAPGAGQTE